mmetsp:Transcript_21153/g.46639  ORF Transcript_21153/g.46639 Transcript_21153/m.46639 type:complete len:301 (-) Transcript_21153:130-1032(-)
MRVKRNKNHRRILRFYRLAHGVSEPYRVLVDGTFLTHALQHRIHVKEQLAKMLDGRTTPMVTNCVCAELRALGDRASGASIIAKGYYRLKCSHEKPIGASACILEQIGKQNERKLLVATSDRDLVTGLREIPGVPLLRLNGQVPLLEEPSAASRASAAEIEAKKLKAAEWERSKLPELRQKEAQAAARALKVKKRRGPKAPNPLSCLPPRRRKQAAQAPPKKAEAAEAPPKPKKVRSRRMAAKSDKASEAVESSPRKDVEESEGAPPQGQSSAPEAHAEEPRLQGAGARKRRRTAEPAAA